MDSPPAPLTMRARVAAFDWSRTPLGPRDAWPQSLRTVVDLVLSSAISTSVLWGDDLIQIYNDAYARVLGPRHPDALGQPVLEVWPETRAVIEPLYTGVRRGETFSFENQRYVLERSGFPEETYFTYCYSPIRDDHAEVGGVLVTGVETTAQVLGARRAEVRLDSSTRLAGAATVADLRHLVETTEPVPDLPFVELYLRGDEAFPDTLLPVLRSGEPLRLNWPAEGEAPRLALALLVDGVEQGEPSGVLVLGLNPQVALDEAYRGFLTEYAQQVGAALVRVRSSEQARLTRKLEEERAVLAAFVAFTEAVGTENDVLALVRRAMQVLGEVGAADTFSYFEREGDHWKFRVWSEDVRQEVLDANAALSDTPLIADALRSRQAVFRDGWDPEREGVRNTEEYGTAVLYPLLVGGEVHSLFGGGSRDRQQWRERDRALFRAVGRGLTLALERAEQVRRLDEERAALDAYTAFTEAVGTETDIHVLARKAVDVLLARYPGGTAVYYEPEGHLWRARVWSDDLRPDLLELLRSGLPGTTPFIAQAVREQRGVFTDQWDPEQQAVEHTGEYRRSGHIPIVLGGEVRGLLGLASREQQHWTGRDRTLFGAVARGLTLALERAEQTLQLDQEREALEAFARFTELTAGTNDVDALAQRAAELLQTTLNVRSAVYFERGEGLWKARYVSGSVAPELESRLYAGLPDSAPSFALTAERREPMFFEPWDAAAEGLPEGAAYGAVARYPLFPPDHPVGILGMASTDAPTWTEREKAVFRAVGDSFRLALERAASIQQIERQRERLSDLNAELGNLIIRTAHNLEEPARRLGDLLDPGRPLDPQALAGLSPYDPAALHDEVTRLRSVAQDLRQLARLEQQDVTKELLSLGELFGEVRAEVSATARGAQMHWRIEPLPIVRGDRALLHQALEVLMTFTLSETRGARYVTVSSREVEGEVQVTVEDDGLGLTGEEAATLFDLTVRTDQAVPLLEGSGLVQVRRILAGHGGWAWAEAQRTSGKVVLAFPRDEAVNELEALFRQHKPGM
ncbi:hypothetical protein DEIPH_ctg026orf0002 [Deinococcus phoenicis]|uniref:histidine kinase n=1 Tax=Deinococcus phoenicis TaxID=1476583 RepID=A0A016QPR1_9DEIO|nr:GAF domain-containing protein [Deinococcus phoenicis]EYB68110.1 hypothetical protein DEIPH_ctg026orf0002 [Deinococcus phoenicis]